MTDDPSKAKWHTIDPATALTLTNQTEKPGLVYPVASNALPQQLQNLPGFVTFHVSSYGPPINLTPGMAAGGEIAVVRHDQGIGKAYNYIFGTSSNGQVCFTGPHKDFPAHHFATTAPVPIESLFGHPFTKGKT
jgi:hypothetical protein